MIFIVSLLVEHGSLLLIKADDGLPVFLVKSYVPLSPLLEDGSPPVIRIPADVHLALSHLLDF